MYHLVYKTTNKTNGKIYIGSHSAKKLKDGYYGSGTSLKQAIKKYGKENFEIEYLFFCETRKEAFDLEYFAIRDHRRFYGKRKVYNVKEKAVGHECGIKHPMWGRKHKESLKAKWSEERMGEKNQFYGKTHSEDTKKKISEFMSTKVKELNNFYGKRHSEKSKKKISKNRKGICKGKEHPNYGKNFSEETKNKISESRKKLGLGKKPVFFRGKNFSSKEEAARTFFPDVSVNWGTRLVNRELKQ